MQLSNALRIITDWLPVLANIAPAKLRREAAAVRELVNGRKNTRSLLYELMLDILPERLVSRRPEWSVDPFLSLLLFPMSETWLSHWSTSMPINGDLILDPNSRLLNRFRTNQGRCGSLMHIWGFTDIPDCDCGADQQTMRHIVNECPLRSFSGGLAVLNEAGPDAVETLGFELIAFHH
jgi:hypothetical protein